MLLPSCGWSPGGVGVVMGRAPWVSARLLLAGRGVGVYRVYRVHPPSKTNRYI